MLPSPARAAPGWATSRKLTGRSTQPATRSARASRICRRGSRRRQRATIASEIQELQSELDLNQARVEALKALAQFESGSASPDQSGGLAAQIDDLEHSISDSNAKRPPALPAEGGFV